MAGKIDSGYLLALNAHPKIGSQTLKKILAFFPDPKKIWTMPKNEIYRLAPEKLAELIIEARNIQPEEELKKLAKNDIGYMTMYDKSYPSQLLEVPDCPAVLYIRGNARALKNPGLGVVGSRKYTNYGKNTAYEISKNCASNGLTIISGLALGIDAFAHRAALDAGGNTIGVLGCGLDLIYPVSNHQLAIEMIEKDGAVISEFPPGTAPMKFNFPARNRIIAGLSLGVLVIEAAEQSGALITAYQALEYNREVFAVPGNIDAENSFGPNKLIKEGARLVMSASDILDELNIEEKTAVSKAKEILPETKEEEKVVEILKAGEKSADEIIELTGLNVIALNTTLTMMEMKGMILNLGGGQYRLNRKG